MPDEKQLVLVETISQYRMRYVVEVPVGIDDYGNDKQLWALDTVTCDEAKEFSQHWLGETIVSHRVIDENQALEIFNEDHDYLKEWEPDKKLACVTRWKEQDS